MSVKEAIRSTAYRLGFARLYFRLFEWRQAHRTKIEQPDGVDGVTLPPPYLIMLVAGTADWKWFIDSGKSTMAAFNQYATEGGRSFESAQRILDLGCGCGRLARHLPAMTKGEIHGTDYNLRLVRWCAKNLTGRFVQNQLNPPLPYPDAHFDVVYLMSVFTHLKEGTQRDWLAELRRVTRPGGVALVTFHDEDYPTISADVREQLAQKSFHVVNDHVQGSNLMAAFQTRDHVRRTFGEHFEVVRVVSSAESRAQQAVAILRRPSA